MYYKILLRLMDDFNLKNKELINSKEINQEIDIVKIIA